MIVVMQIVGLASGEHHPFDRMYVKEFDPSVRRDDGSYDGGRLVVVSTPEEARTFADQTEALEYWKQSYGIRPDGEPNRPLTAFTVNVHAAPTPAPPGFISDKAWSQ